MYRPKVYNLHYLPMLIELCDYNEAYIEICDLGLGEGIEITIEKNFEEPRILHDRKFYDIKDFYDKALLFFKEES